MSQCSQGKRRTTLIRLGVITLALSGCNFVELERFATEYDADTTTTVPGNVQQPINYSHILRPHAIIRGGKRNFEGAAGVFARILVGDTEEIRFVSPVAVSGVGEYLYIVDAGARAIFKYHTIKQEISAFNGIGVHFVGDLGNIYVAKDKSFYAVDGVGKQVFHFSDTGKLLQTFSDPANLSRPIDVLLDEVNGDLLVADGSYSHIVVFNKFGKATRTIGRRSTETVKKGRFRAITSMTWGRDGLYVTDRLELPVQVISNDGVYRYSFGQTYHKYPTSVAVSVDQYVFVSDKNDNTIRIYQNGQFLADAGSGGSGPGRFRLPTDLWVNNNYLYVADSLNRRIQVLKIIGGSTELKL